MNTPEKRAMFKANGTYPDETQRIQMTRNVTSWVTLFAVVLAAVAKNKSGQVSLTATVTCNQYYLLSCGADGAR